MNRRKLRLFIETSAWGRALLIPYRIHLALSYYYVPLRNIFWWSLKSKEHTNFTFDLDDLNREYLIAFIAHITQTQIDTIRNYVIELEQDESLSNHINRLTKASNERHVADEKAKYGRRLGWYAVIRAAKPKVVVETGIDKGLGSCVITAALMRNAQEGYPGFMYGTDINPRAGYLLQAPYSQYGRILYGDSIESLKQLSEQIDVFINDSDHSPAYEMEEYETIQDKLTVKAIILGDNAHCTDSLFKFAQISKRNFLFYQEKPKEHWYPGDGIGAAFRWS
jgi:predicted O-methyltransferase YrrM